MVVILGGIAFLALNQFSKNNSQIKSTIRRISVLSKDLHNAARMQNKTYRMVLQMNPEGQAHGIYVESAPKGTMITMFSEALPDERDSNRRKDEEAPPPAFSIDQQVLKSPLSIPGNIRIKDVEIKGQDPITEGKAYIYFLPEGLTQEAAIHLSDGDTLNWTIAIHPITGQSRIITEERPLKDLRTE